MAFNNSASARLKAFNDAVRDGTRQSLSRALGDILSTYGNLNDFVTAAAKETGQDPKDIAAGIKGAVGKFSPYSAAQLDKVNSPDFTKMSDADAIKAAGVTPTFNQVGLAGVTNNVPLPAIKPQPPAALPIPQAKPDVPPMGVSAVPLPQPKPIVHDSVDAGFGSAQTNPEIAAGYGDMGPAGFGTAQSNPEIGGNNAQGIAALGAQTMGPDAVQSAAQKTGIDPGLIALSAGLGILASKSHNFAGAVGEGGLRGLQTFLGLQQQQQRNQRLDRNDQLAQKRMDLAQANAAASRDLQEQGLALRQKQAESTDAYNQARLAALNDPEKKKAELAALNALTTERSAQAKRAGRLTSAQLKTGQESPSITAQRISLYNKMTANNPQIDGKYFSDMTRQERIKAVNDVLAGLGAAPPQGQVEDPLGLLGE